ncbi:MAG: hypothetical protein NTV74_06875 [Euryarchaeota archaeon]|nr:hypothetical protein [Euryarchaeota archaeon]
MKKIITGILVMFLLINLSSSLASGMDFNSQLKNKKISTSLYSDEAVKTDSDSWFWARVLCTFSYYSTGEFIDGKIFVYGIQISGVLEWPLIINGVTKANAGQYVTLTILATTKINFNVGLNQEYSLRGFGCLGVSVITY